MSGVVPHAGPSAIRPTLYVMVGLPGSGKTTVAQRLENERMAVRLTPDEWMIPLFGEPEADGRRDVLEGRFVWLALRILRLGLSVVLDFGVWSKDERSALRSLAADVGADCELVYLAVDAVEQRRRVEERSITAPHSTFAITEDDLECFRQRFQEPDHTEHPPGPLDPPPAPHVTWRSWASGRWPTSAG